jgi:uncharacterized membrane protein (TIGR02234 family)
VSSSPPAQSPPPETGRASPPPARRRAHREYGAALAAGALGAGIALLAAREPWAHARFPADNPLPGSTVALTGQDLSATVSALAIAGLACLAAVIATRRVLRRITGIVLAVFGAGTAVAAATSTGAAHVAAVAAGHSPVPYGSGVSAHPAGPRPEITMVAFPWWAVALTGGVLLVAAGLLTMWRGSRWPGMSSRYERPGGAPAVDSRDPATVWEALDRGTDPTAGAPAPVPGPGQGNSPGADRG